MTKNFLTALWNKIKSNFVQKDSSGNVNLSGGTISSNTLSGTTVRANAIEGLTGGSNVPSIKVQQISGVSGGINMQSGTIYGINTITMNELNGYSGEIKVNGNKIYVGRTGNTNNLTLWCSGDGQGSINGLKTLNMYSGVIDGVQSINGKNIEFKTQAQYNALSTKDSNTLYVITG